MYKNEQQFFSVCENCPNAIHVFDHFHVVKHCHISTTKVEGINNKIKVMKRIALWV